jgi:hypothetical protein
MGFLRLRIGALVRVTQATLFVLPWNITTSAGDLKGSVESAASGRTGASA